MAHFLGLKNLFPATVAEASAGHIVADCPSLNHRFRLPGQAPIGAAITLGIRAEDVMLRDADHPPHPGDCVLTGNMRLIGLGANVIMHFDAPHLPSLIEIAASRHVANRFGITQDQSRMTIALRPSAMFWVSQVDLAGKGVRP